MIRLRFAGPEVTRLISSRVRWPQRIVHGEREADRVPEGSFRLSPAACFACIVFFICVKILPSRCRQQAATEVLTCCNVGRADQSQHWTQSRSKWSTPACRNISKI